MAEINLSASVRQNLLALQSTANAMSQTQNRLATGLKVNSALDNPNSYFTAQALNNRASDLSNLLDSMGQGVETLKAADNGIKAIQKLVQAAKAKANQALEASDTGDRATYSGEFNDLLDQIELLAGDSGYNGKNLLGGTGNDLTVKMNEDGSSEVTVTAVDYTDVATTLGLDDAANSWASDTDINTSLDNVNSALEDLRTQSSTFGTNLTVVQNRQDFTKNMIATLQEGSGMLTLADTNEEGANLLALQTRQQLSTTALSFASQADQNVLKLF